MREAPEAAGSSPSPAEGAAPSAGTPEESTTAASAGQQDAPRDDAGAADDEALIRPGSSAAGETAKNDGAGEEQGAGEVDPADTVPEDGAYELELPEEIEYDSALAERTFPVFKELGLTRRQVQGIASAFSEHLIEKAKQEAEAFTAQSKEWIASAKADETYSKVGFEAAIAIANRASDRFGDEEFHQMLQVSGLNNHPAIMRLLFRVGQSLLDDTTPRTVGGGEIDEPIERRLYGATTPERKRE